MTKKTKLIYRSTQCRGRMLTELSTIFKCPACEYEMSYFDEAAASAGALTHARIMGRSHDEVLMDLLASTSPLWEQGYV